MGDLSYFLGTLVAVVFVTGIWFALLRRINNPNTRILSAAALGLITATIVGGFGNADGGPPDFSNAFLTYALPQLVITGLMLWGQSRRGAAGPVAVAKRGARATERIEPTWGEAVDQSPPSADVDVLTSEAVRAALERDRSSSPPPPLTGTQAAADEGFQVAPPLPAAGITGRNLITRHWQGGYSLGLSYWGINLLANVALLVVAAGLAVALTPERGYEPVAIFGLIVTVWAITFAVLIWQVVGLWRSADRHAEARRRLGRGAFWARAAQVMAVIAVLQTVGAFNSSGQPQVAELYRMAFLGDPDIPPSELRLLDGGGEISLVGGIKYGLARDIETLLRAAPQVTVLHLTSPGGRIAEASKIADLVRARGLDTFVGNECSSACTVIFVAGQRRVLLDGAQLGFHGSTFPGLTLSEQAEANESFASLYRAAGVERSFIQRAIAVAPNDMWYPQPGELRAAGVVTAVSDGSNFATSGNETIPTLEAIEREMREASGVIDAIHRLEPETARQMYAYMRQGLVAGMAQETMTSEIQRQTAEAIIRAYPKADDATLVEVARLLSDQYSALLQEDPALCFFYAAGQDASNNAYNRLPAILRSLELEINERILRTARPRDVPTPARAEVIFSEIGTAVRRTLSERQIDLFAGDAESVTAADYGHYCLAAIVFYREIAALPPSVAGEIMRYMFSRT